MPNLLSGTPLVLCSAGTISDKGKWPADTIRVKGKRRRSTGTIPNESKQRRWRHMAEPEKKLEVKPVTPGKKETAERPEPAGASMEPNRPQLRPRTNKVQMPHTAQLHGWQTCSGISNLLWASPARHPF